MLFNKWNLIVKCFYYSFHLCNRDIYFNICTFKLSFGTEIGTENRGFLLVSVSVHNWYP